MWSEHESPGGARAQPGLVPSSLRTHHAVLGLQLDLQGVDRASQLDDLCLAGLQLLRAGHHLLVQLLSLKHAQAEPGQDRWGLSYRGPQRPL